MRPFRFKLDVWLLVFFKLHADLALCRNDVFQMMSDISDLCPYSSFCGRNALMTFPESEDLQPCCESCSCGTDCALQGDCCFSNKDKYYTESDPRVICRSVFAVEPPPKSDIFSQVQHGHRYRMVNRCSNVVLESGVNEASCEQFSLNILETFKPVVSTKTGLIYISAHCALCNNETETIPWQPVVTCSKQYESDLSDAIESLVSGRTSNDTECYLFYIPPQGLDLAPSASCNQMVVRTCPVPESISALKYRHYCEMFNATFVLQTGGLLRLYANVYCLMCHNPSLADKIKEIDYKICPKFGMIYSEKLFWKQSLTVMLDQFSLDINTVAVRLKKQDGCPPGSVNVTSFVSACRPRRCPWGQILLNDRCGYYSKGWIGGPFVVMLRLKPVKRKEQTIPVSFFEDMPDLFKADTQAFWIKRKTLTRWRFYVMYKCKDKHFVDHLVVRATYPSTLLNPKHLQVRIQQALEDTWLVEHMNTSIAFRVEFNEYIHYDFITVFDWKKTEIDNSTELGYYPRWLLCMEGLPLSGNDNVKEFLFPISNFKETFGKELFITKLLFCDQVDLEPTEYVYECDSIFFRVRRIRLHVFNLVTSGKTLPRLSEYPFKNDLNARICLHEFDQTHSATIVNTYHFMTALPFVYLVQF